MEWEWDDGWVEDDSVSIETGDNIITGPTVFSSSPIQTKLKHLFLSTGK
jgi:hypothetical protein